MRLNAEGTRVGRRRPDRGHSFDPFLAHSVPAWSPLSLAEPSSSKRSVSLAMMDAVYEKDQNPASASRWPVADFFLYRGAGRYSIFSPACAIVVIIDPSRALPRSQRATPCFFLLSRSEENVCVFVCGRVWRLLFESLGKIFRAHLKFDRSGSAHRV